MVVVVCTTAISWPYPFLYSNIRQRHLIGYAGLVYFTCHSSAILNCASLRPKTLKTVAAMPTAAMTKGKMLLVGAGPGDPDLLTVKAYRALQQADLVLADRLVPSDVLEIAKCEVRVARKHCGQADFAQAELDAWGLEALAKGKRVVRLKNGDPFLYGRGGEEVVIYSKAGFDVEVIPGISSALSAPASAGIPSTMRDVADQVLICTGHGKKDRFPDLPEYCDHRTTIFLMAIGRIEGICEALQAERGYPSDMPAAVIHAATMRNAATVRSTLGTIAEEVRRRGIDPPGTLVLGNVVNALTYLRNFDAVKDVDVEPESSSTYTISYAPLSCLPEIDLGEHIVLNAKTKRPEIFGLDLWIVNVVLVVLASIVTIASGVAITQA